MWLYLQIIVKICRSQSYFLEDKSTFIFCKSQMKGLELCRYLCMIRIILKMQQALYGPHSKFIFICKAKFLYKICFMQFYGTIVQYGIWIEVIAFLMSLDWKNRWVHCCGIGYTICITTVYCVSQSDYWYTIELFS